MTLIDRVIRNAPHLCRAADLPEGAWFTLDGRPVTARHERDGRQCWAEYEIGIGWRFWWRAEHGCSRELTAFLPVPEPAGPIGRHLFSAAIRDAIAIDAADARCPRDGAIVCGGGAVFGPLIGRGGWVAQAVRHWKDEPWRIRVGRIRCGVPYVEVGPEGVGSPRDAGRAARAAAAWVDAYENPKPKPEPRRLRVFVAVLRKGRRRVRLEDIDTTREAEAAPNATTAAVCRIAKAAAGAVGWRVDRGLYVPGGVPDFGPWRVGRRVVYAEFV